MNFCNRSEEVLDYLLGNMDLDRRLSFESHLSSCPVCSGELSLERRIEEGLKSSPAAPADMESRIEMAVRLLSRQARPRSRFGRTLAGFAAAAVMVTACWMVSYRLLEGFVPSGATGEVIRALTQLTSSAGANLGTLLTAGTLTAAAIAIAAVLPGE